MKESTGIQPRSFLYREEQAVAYITLNRPDKLNALTFEVYAELRDAFRALQTRDDVRVVVIAGRGRGFCSGGDVHSIIGQLLKRDMRGLLDFTRMTGEVVKTIRALRKPVMASLNGTTAGAGAVIALACDLRIAAETAKMAFLFVNVGLSGADMGAAYLLPKVVGLGRATELLYTGDFISAQQAYEYGLYNRVVNPEALEAETRAWAEKLASGPAFSLGMTKEMLNRELNLDLEEALEAEAQAQALCMFHPDYREAYEAFVQKREPEFNQR